MFKQFEWILNRYEELSAALVEPEVLADTARYQACLKEHAALKEQAEAWTAYQALLSHEQQARDMLSDPDFADMAREELSALLSRKGEMEQALRLLLLPRDPDDDHSVIVEIRGGAGGEESCLFAAEMVRMYARFAERHGFRVAPFYSNDTELGGVKECCFSVIGKGAYALMKYESGVHRVQRIPVTDATGKRQSSTCTVAVLPEAEEIELTIDPRDIRVDVYRSSGSGGQHVNTTDSAVRLTHLPTGLVVSCQAERSQIQNRARAMQILRSRLLERSRLQHNAEYAQNRRIQVGTGDRSERIRTYNFHEGRVTDHRIGLTLYGMIGSIMDGDLDEIVHALREKNQQILLQNESNRS